MHGSARAQEAVAQQSRPLSGNEKSFWKLGESSSLNFAMIAHVRPGLAPARLARALRSLQARHPLLRARIELRAGGKPWFAWPDEVPPIPVDVRKVAKAEWKPAMDDEIRVIIPWDRPPMARAVVLDHGEDGATLALVFQHAIGDGMCGIPALRDVLWEATTGRARSDVVYTRSVPAEDALPRRYLGVRGGLRRIGVLAELAATNVRARDPLKCPTRQFAAPHERTYHSDLRAFETPVTAALTERARREGSTIQGAVGAALLMGVARLAGIRDERTVTLGSPINLRPLLSHDVGEQMGLYLGVSAFRDIVSPKTHLWALARAIRERITDDIESGRALAGLPLSNLFYESLGGDKVSAEEFGRRWAQGNGTTGLTNIGRIAIDPPPGLEIERVHAMAFPSGLDVFNVIGSAWRGSMMLSFNWCEPCFDRETATGLFDDIEALVRAAAAGGDPALGSRAA